MRVAAKPMSSPGRAEKYYPPPLMRFLRSNVGSKSRGRTTSSRSSPLMFISRRRSSNAPSSSLEAQQEPCSPKVTCMGQVRVRRSARPARPGAGEPTRRRRCYCPWIPAAPCCHEKKTCHCHCLPSCVTGRPPWPKWKGFLFFHSSKDKPKQEEGEEKEEEEEDSSRAQQVFEPTRGGFKEEEEDEVEERTRVSDVARSVSPPKNALLLTRCRSAPYRSSSLACRFWGSPLGGGDNSEETTRQPEQVTRADQEQVEQGNKGEEEEVESSSSSPISKRKEEETEEQVEQVGLVEELRTEEGTAPVTTNTTTTTAVFGPVILTRCKSEPARTGGEKLDTEVGFWNQRTLGFT